MVAKESNRCSGVQRQVYGFMVGMTILVLSVSCSKPSSPAAAEPASAAAKASADPKPIDFDACTLISAADASHILGMPVRVRPTNVSGCAYEGKPPASETWMPSVSLSVRKYQTAADEASAWDDLKLIRSLHEGRKNLTVVNGIGTEAYLENIPGKTTVETTVIVHKEKSDFQLKEVTDRAPAPDALKAFAQKVAAELP